MTLVSMPIPTSPRDLPAALDDAGLLAGGFITGFAVKRMTDAYAAEVLADPKAHAHASTVEEIAAFDAAESAAAQLATDQHAAREAELQARCDVQKTHA